jgi:hypothetical protein
MVSATGPLAFATLVAIKAQNIGDPALRRRFNDQAQR